MKKLILLATSLVLFGCGSGERDERAVREETVGKQIADDYNRSMQKARDVEIQLEDSKQRMEEALREAEGATRDP